MDTTCRGTRMNPRRRSCSICTPNWSSGMRRSDVEGYTIEFLGTRLYYFWAETCQEYMEQFRPRFRDHWGYPYPGIELDNWGNPKPES